MAPVDWKVVAEKLSQLDIWLAARERERGFHWDLTPKMDYCSMSTLLLYNDLLEYKSDFLFSM